MHLPDGFLDAKISMGLMGAAVAVVSFSLSKVRAKLTVLVPQYALAAAGRGARSFSLSQKVVSKFSLLMGLVAATILFAQAFDFTLFPGVTGHFLGGAFAAILLGPFAGTITMAVVLIAQSLFWGDGGRLALGANIINIAVIGCFTGYYLYVWLKRLAPEWLSIGLAAWLSVVLSAAAYGAEVSLSGQGFILPEMLKVHSLIGSTEALFTIALSGIFRSSAPLIRGNSKPTDHQPSLR